MGNSLNINVGLDGVPQVVKGFQQIETASGRIAGGMDSAGKAASQAGATMNASNGRIVPSSDAAASATGRLSSATSGLIGLAKQAAAAFGLYKLVSFAQEAALMAAKYQTMGVVMNTVGATAGYTNVQMAGYEKQLQKNGIAMVESRQTLTQMAQAHLDLSKASELSSIAQDAATIGGINSSEAFERMITGIQRGETEILKTIGINVNFEQSYEKMAMKLNKSVDALTENEKATARMNAVLDRGKDIAGVYEAAMGTAGKQLTSMKRYMDNLKVTVGGVFNDALIAGVQAVTGGLKEANTEAEKMQQQGQLDAMGRRIVETIALIADAVSIVYKVMIAFVSFCIGGWQSIYSAAKAVFLLLSGDWQGAKAAMAETKESIKATMSVMSDQFSGDWADKYRKATKAMYDQRDASKAVEEQKKKELEQRQKAAGVVNQEEQDAEQLALQVKKHRDEWAKIVVAQLESVGAYEQATAKQIELNKLTDAYKTMKTLSEKSPEAAAALKAQELLDQQKLLEAKRKELEFDTTHQQTLLNIEKSKQAILGYSNDEITATTGYKEALLQEQIILNQIATESNPRRITQLQEQLDKQQSLNRLVREEAEYKAQAAKRQAIVSAANDAITLGRAAGEDTSRLENTALMTAYDARRAEYQKQIAIAQETGNGTLANTISKASSYLDQLYSQRDVNGENLKTLQDILGVQSGITNECKKQAEFGGGKIVKDGDGNDLLVSQVWDSTNADDHTYLNQLMSNMKSVMSSGLDGGYGMSLWKQYLAESNRLTELANQKLLDEQIAANKVVISAMQTAAGDLSDSASALVKSGTSLATSLRTAADKLIDTQISLATSDNSTLSPQQQYQLAKDTFLNTAAQAQSSGDVDLYNQLPTLASNLLKLSQSYYASGVNFVNDYNSVQSILAESAARADVQATTAEQTVTLLQRQADLLADIKTALSNGSSITTLLSDLNSVNNQLNTTMSTVNTSVGQTTAAALATNTTTGTVADNVANNNTLTSSGTNTLASWLSSVNTNNANISAYTNSTKSVLQSSLLASSLFGRIAKVEHRAAAGGSISTNSDDTYTYYRYGGIADDPTGHSIFGEAGPEAAVPLPDGRTIPVTLSRPADNYKLDLSEITNELAALRMEVQSLRKQQAGETDRLENASGKVAAAVNGNASARVRL